MIQFGLLLALIAWQPPGPLSAEDSLAAISVLPGLRVQLVAAEPLVCDPVAIAFGPEGRLWVVEMSDYPLHETAAATGRVRYLEDTDGDGTFDRSTLFLDGLEYPNSVLPWRDGVLVCCPPEIFFAKDTDGDGQADVRETLYQGLAEGNPQHRVNGLRWGLDNWVYCANGDNGGTIHSVRTGEELLLGKNDLRLHPQSGGMDLQTGTSQFSRCQDDWGNWFGGNNSAPIWHIVLRDQDLRQSSYGLVAQRKAYLKSPSARLRSLAPKQKRLNQPEAIDRFTASCGLEIYRDHWLGNNYLGAYFVCEPAHQLVHAAVLQPAGVTFIDQPLPGAERQEFLASRDLWFRPVSARTGPDGAVWIVDMYRQVIEHPEYIPQRWHKDLDFDAGRGRGRIYRVVPADQPHGQICWPRLTGMATAELVTVLESPNGPLRDMAQQLLIERQDATCVPLLMDLMRGSESPTARLHALATLDGLAELTSDLLLAALEDERPELRRHALRLSTDPGVQDPRLTEAVLGLANDPSLAVQLQLVSLLTTRDDGRADETLARLALQNGTDPYFADAVLAVADSRAARLLKSLLDLNGLTPDHSELLSELMMQTMQANDWAVLKACLARMGQGGSELEPEAWRWATLAGFSAKLRRARLSLADLNTRSTGQLASALEGLRPLEQHARHVALDLEQSTAVRCWAVAILGQDPATLAADVDAAAALLIPQTPGRLQEAAVSMLQGVRQPEIGSLLLANWSSYSPDLQRQVLEVIMQRPDWTGLLLDGLEAGQIQPQSLGTADRQAMLRHRFPAIRQRSEAVFGQPTQSDRAAVVQRYTAALTDRGDRERGQEFYRKACASCHETTAEQTALGPNLRELGQRSNEQWLVDILDPNRNIEPKYQQYTAVLIDGGTFSGLIAADSQNAIRLVDAQGRSTLIPRDSIESLQSSGSLMPNGMEAELSPEQMSDLLEFLQQGL